MKANTCRCRRIEKECVHRFDDIAPKLVPGVGLREDVFGQAFGAKTAIGFLNDFEHEFLHILHDTVMSPPVWVGFWTAELHADFDARDFAPVHQRPLTRELS